MLVQARLPSVSPGGQCPLPISDFVQARIYSLYPDGIVMLWSEWDVGRGESPLPISLLVQARFPSVYPDGIVMLWSEWDVGPMSSREYHFVRPKNKRVLSLPNDRDSRL